MTGANRADEELRAAVRVWVAAGQPATGAEVEVMARKAAAAVSAGGELGQKVLRVLQEAGFEEPEEGE